MFTNAVLSNTCGLAAGVFWLFAYVAIIRRGFKDRSLAMPMVALSANISWEAIFSFIYIPPNKLIHYSSIIWFCFDLPIALQCFLYGANNSQPKFIQKNFRLFFLASIAISFLILVRFIYDFNDKKGAYSGYGINLMMSILFVGMLIQRDGILGQSIYIALCKWLGTFFAFFASFFGSAIDINATFNIHALLTEIISNQTYLLKSTVKVLYPIIFMIDVLYIVLLYRQLRNNKLNPWTRL
ncbi:hypothetical protein [Allocoleopsis sp.]|uniref:transmembrane-type terpene cyclase n=1 Tax=Allocoleopsis sp. TaxID=3088169 RepID=UPI002FD38F92